MLNLLCVCGNGMGTSTILKLSVKEICERNGVSCQVESCSFGEAMMYIQNTDVVVTSPEWSEMLPPNNAVIVKTKNLIDKAAVEEALISAINEHYPEEINK